MDWLDQNEKRTPEQINDTSAQAGATPMGLLSPNYSTVKYRLITLRSIKVERPTAYVQPRSAYGGEQ